MSNFKSGDIVVSLIEQTTGHTSSTKLFPGDINKIYSCDWEDMWFKGDGLGSYKNENFRLATTDEAEYFHKGVKNTFGIPSSSLIPGTWYKTIGTQFTTNKYIKYHSIDSRGKIVYSERITHAEEHHVFREVSNYQSSSIANPGSSLVLVPDEEVTPYLNKIINSFPIY